MDEQEKSNPLSPFDAERETVIKKLEQPLDPNLVATRVQQGVTLRYIEGFQAINTANEIFGYDGWSVENVKVDLSRNEAGRPIYYAVVSVYALGVTKTDVGCGVPAGDTQGAHDTAIKAAVTDAMKRALRQFGQRFANSLYDKNDTTGKTTTRKSPVTATSVFVETPPIPCQKEGCKNELTGYSSTKPGGKRYNSQEQAEQSVRLLGGPVYCREHFSERYRQIHAAESAEPAADA